jgi:Leu/Phe-tRNA-protein transferase
MKTIFIYFNKKNTLIWFVKEPRAIIPIPGMTIYYEHRKIQGFRIDFLVWQFIVDFDRSIYRETLLSEIKDADHGK